MAFAKQGTHVLTRFSGKKGGRFESHRGGKTEMYPSAKAMKAHEGKESAKERAQEKRAGVKDIVSPKPAGGKKTPPQFKKK